MTPVFAHGQLRLYLLSLLQDGPRHGYEVIRDLQERFDGLYTPSAGTVYPRLQRLEEEGLVVRVTSSGRGSGRKVTYQITEAGRLEVGSRREDLAALDVDLAASVRRLAEDVRRRVRTGSQDLRGELAQAAKVARASSTTRAAHHAGRSGAQLDAELDAALDDLRHELRRSLRAGVAERARAVVEAATLEVRRLRDG